MINQVIMNELDELKEGGLIKDYKIIKNQTEVVEFNLTTLENMELDIYSEFGWGYTVKNDSSKSYESFEQILRKYSDKYSEKFAEILMKKINQLQKDQGELENEDNN
jgi:hypothetical protein